MFDSNYFENLQSIKQEKAKKNSKFCRILTIALSCTAFLLIVVQFIVYMVSKSALPQPNPNAVYPDSAYAGYFALLLSFWLLVTPTTLLLFVADAASILSLVFSKDKKAFSITSIVLSFALSVVYVILFFVVVYALIFYMPPLQDQTTYMLYLWA